MFLLSDVLTYIRRIIKSPSNAQVTDDLLLDYVNRFWITDVDARIQVFDLKTKYQFQTCPGFDQYNMPLYNFQTESGSQSIGLYPVYQGFMSPAYINGSEVGFYTQKSRFFSMWPNVVQQSQVVGIGDGSSGPYILRFTIAPNNLVPVNPPVEYLLRGHVDMSGIIATGNNVDPPTGTTLNLLIPSTSIYPAVYFTSISSTGNSVVVQDSGQFLSSDINYGLLMKPGNAPFGYTAFGSYTTLLNTVNYLSGVAYVNFPVAIPAGVNINAQCYFFQSGLPSGVLFNNNTLTLRSPPDRQYLVELDAYLSPAAFLNTSAALQFGYMAEYIARGAARKILSDTGDVDQFMFYEPLFKEQELLVWKRSQRQFTATRTQTIYSQGQNNYPSGYIR